jgi:hypothetical protein
MKRGQLASPRRTKPTTRGTRRGVNLGGAFLLAVGLTTNVAAPARAQSYTFSHLAGSAGGPGSADGTGSAARFDHPRGVAVDGAGTAYVTDTDSGRIRKVTAAGVVTTLAGGLGPVRKLL